MNFYQCSFTLNILFDEVDRGLEHEIKTLLDTCLSRIMFNNLTKLTKILTKKVNATDLFHFGRITGSIKIFRWYKKLWAK